MRRTKEDAEQTRRDILASAMDIFYEKGYSKTTFDEIAKRINLTKGAVYWYFRNKPDIVAALINEYAGKYLDELKDYVENHKPATFDSIIEMQILNNRRIREDIQFYKFLFFISCQMEWSEAIVNKIQPSIEQTKQEGKALFLDALSSMQHHKLIRSDVDISIICEILMNMYHGILAAYFTKRLTADFDELVKIGFTLIFNNIKTEGTNNED